MKTGSSNASQVLWTMSDEDPRPSRRSIRSRLRIDRDRVGIDAATASTIKPSQINHGFTSPDRDRIRARIAAAARM